MTTISGLSSHPSRIQCRGRSTRGFNLIEISIVLAIVGLVIGGIWVSFAHVRQAQRISELTRDVLLITENARKLFTTDDYPGAGLVTNVTATAISMGVFPSSYTYSSAQGSGLSTNGAVVRLNLGRSGTTPQIRVLVYVNGGRGSTLTLAECTQLAIRVGGHEQGSSNLQRVQFNTAGGGSVGISYPPITLTNSACTSTVGYVEFWYKPKY